jgi:hypothetical protein
MPECLVLRSPVRENGTGAFFQVRVSGYAVWDWTGARAAETARRGGPAVIGESAIRPGLGPGVKGRLWS